ncbi:MAG: TonB-dependent receptor [Pedobacter sp.]|nr:MAG: TonB-dependent receptor [Pedobacter sp.]
MKIYLFIVGLLFPCFLHAQVITGKVTNNKKQALKGANVHWLGKTIAVATDDQGQFKLNAVGITHRTLVASFTGYVSDTVEIGGKTYVDLSLREEKNLDEVIVSARRNGIINSSLSPFKVEQITLGELAKAACCDLAGCFETQLTVQPQTTNVVTNSKELRILGLSGIYNQVLIDGFPMIQGLSNTYGISSNPGTLVESIHISKGANSVAQGYESISGQINVETRRPELADKLLLNLYTNNFLEKHVNANYAFTTGKWSNITAFHTVQPADKVDRDGDNFLDLPKLTRYMLFNRLRYGKENNWGLHSSIGIRLLNEERTGGQRDYDPKVHKGSSSVYGQNVRYNQPEISAKTGFRFNDIHHIVLSASSFYQKQHSYFGTAKYDARQLNIYGNLQHELTYGQNGLRTGISLRYLNLKEDIAFTETTLARTYAGNYLRNENVLGAFAENTMKLFDGKLTWIAGARIDHHNQFGMMFTPRTLLKYDVSANTVIRANVGTGWRTVNLFSENINLLASSRDIIFQEALRPEKAVNLGGNLTQKFELLQGDISGSLSLDYYHTNFQNQIFPDYDSDPTKAFIGNFSGTSISNGFQSELYLQLWKRFEVKGGYNYLDVYQRLGGVKNVLPFNPKHKVLTTFSYKPVNGKFHFDVNVHWFGQQRLPNTQANPAQYRRPDFSRSYTTASGQLTYKFGNLEIYGGAENIFNFRQHQPIISWQEPFGPYFDTSSVWGPTRGRELYLGMRFKLPKVK